MERSYEMHPELKKYIPIAESIYENFGKNTEVVIHDLRYPESSLVYIIGNVTRREIGAPATNLILETLHKDKERKEGEELIQNICCYKTVTKDGRILRSSSTFIRNEQDEIIGCLCINYDITDFLHCNRIIEDFTAFPEKERKTQQKKEFFANHVKENLEDIVLSVIQKSTIPVELMAKEDKIELMRIFEEKGVFLVKGAVEYVAEVFNVSRYTIYNYLDEIRHSNI